MDEDKFLRCIVDNNRRRILKCLIVGEKSVNEIIEQTSLEQTLVSFHLKALRNCGLVKSKREGKKIIYKISHEGIIDILNSINEISSEIKDSFESDKCE